MHSKRNKTSYLLVGIAGGSASGKTFLINAIAQNLDKRQVTILSLDNYYKPREEQERLPDGSINFDHPNALNLDKAYSDLIELLNGNELILKEYNFNNPNKPDKWLHFSLTPILVVEGLFTFYKPEIRDLFHLKIFVEAEEHIKLIRRIHRDHEERGYSIESILSQYAKYVVPMYKQFVEPTKQFADIILQNNQPQIPKGIDVVVNYLKFHLQSHPTTSQTIAL